MIENGGENENGGEIGIGGEDKRIHHRKRTDHHMSRSIRSESESENESRLPLCLGSKNDI